MQTGWETSVQAVAAKKNKIFNITELAIPTIPIPLCDRFHYVLRAVWELPCSLGWSQTQDPNSVSQVLEL